MKRWYPKTLGRAARYLRRNRRLGQRPEGSELYRRQLICQIKLDVALKCGVKHHYNVSSGKVVS